MAGIIGAKRNGTGIVGIAPDASLYAVKSLDMNGEGTLQDVLEGIDWSITKNMDIINLSLGTTFDSSLLRQMINKANDAGIIVVASAGNDGGAVNYPANYDSVIAVSALSSDKTIATFSSRGAEVEFTAPGDEIISTYNNGGYAQASGTSQASPHVSGMLAVLKQKNPNMTNRDLRTELRKYVEDLSTVGRDELYGYGLVNYAAYKAEAKTVAPITDTTAPDAYHVLPDVSERSNLQKNASRLKSKIITATIAVAYAKKYKTQTYLNNAQVAINKLPKGSEKDRLQKWLNIVNTGVLSTENKNATAAIK